ncbi:hypothetical protein SDC9_179588 [bioreactor metagenome]|uniref:Uncharacterized protein n=1 Tax=bioreactor metagenome TaxID=1076179 RepID=A0A645H1B5_9ZZZZ
MILQARDLIAKLCLHRGKEFRVRGIHGAAEHAVLPDEQAFFITEIVESLVLVEPASPNSDHIHVGFDARLQKLVIPIFGDS